MSTKRDLREIWEAKVRIASEIGNRTHPTASRLDPTDAAQKKLYEGLFKSARSDRDAAQAAYLSAPDDPVVGQGRKA